MRITLVLGGARSGKSEIAERLVAELGSAVTYVATAHLDGDDADLLARVAAHRQRRPESWTTVEADDDLATLLRGIDGPVLLDSLGMWVAGVDGYRTDVGAFCGALTERRGSTVVVSDEVGLGVVPPTEAGGNFRDALGALNRAVADVADDVFLVVAGRRLRLDGP